MSTYQVPGTRHAECGGCCESPKSSLLSWSLTGYGDTRCEHWFGRHASSPASEPPTPRSFWGSAGPVTGTQSTPRPPSSVPGAGVELGCPHGEDCRLWAGHPGAGGALTQETGLHRPHAEATRSLGWPILGPGTFSLKCYPSSLQSHPV